jgi:SAM-dependent methyltransferase
MTIASQDGHSVPDSIWKDTGITEHMGGIRATELLLKMIDARPGERAIDMGCGTGHTACTMAKKSVEVVAFDIDSRMLARAKARAARSGTADKISFIQADIHYLPFREGTFDTALAESVLTFCDADRVSREAYRVLKPGGAFGVNELTYLKSPDPALKAMLRLTLKLSPLTDREWKLLFLKSGFVDVVSRISKIHLPGQFMSHLKIDGPIAYSSALVKSIFKPAITRAFLSPKMPGAVMKYRSYVGYGLYSGRKP